MWGGVYIPVTLFFFFFSLSTSIFFPYRMTTTGLVFVKIQDPLPISIQIDFGKPIEPLNVAPFTVSNPLNQFDWHKRRTNCQAGSGLEQPYRSWDLDIFSSSYLFSMNILKIIRALAFEWPKKFYFTTSKVTSSIILSHFTIHPTSEFLYLYHLI